MCQMASRGSCQNKSLTLRMRLFSPDPLTRHRGEPRIARRARTVPAFVRLYLQAYFGAFA